MIPNVRKKVITMKRLNEVFNHWNTTWGFFQALYAYFGLSTMTEDPPPWLTSTTATQLDFIYHTRSGLKPIAPLVENFVEDDEVSLTDAIRIAGMFWTVFGDYCKKEYAVLALQYDPIKNYAMTESGTDTHARTKSATHSGSETIEKRGDEKITKTGTETLGKTGNETTTKFGKIHTETDTDEDIFGYDSSAQNGVPANHSNTSTVQNFGYQGDNYSEIRTPSITDTRTPNLTDTRTPNLVDTRRPNLSDSEAENVTDTHSFEKSGNIGVTLAQRMIEAEIKLWQWNFFYKFLFPCVDRVLTLPIY